MNSLLKSAGLAATALLAALCLSHPVGAIEIVAPKDGAVVPIGAELLIQVQPSPGDDIDRAYLAHSDEHMKHNPQTGYFEQRIKLRGDSLGPIEIEVWSKNSKGVVSTAKVTVQVNLPPVLPLISLRIHAEQRKLVLEAVGEKRDLQVIGEFPDRKSTRLNSSHRTISYAVFCLKKKITFLLLTIPEQELSPSVCSQALFSVNDPASSSLVYFLPLQADLPSTLFNSSNFLASALV